MKTDLQKIPYVGKETEQDLRLLGFDSIASLKGADPEKMYEKECALKGVKVDKCQLYVYRMAVYYAENEVHDPEKLKWWNWKD
ncbi:MAG: helix-hairpin-helix domain-containing protein [Bacteroidales bacterium]|nr:helix-hairpin-helix domain-containing protein [Anaerotignum sp.]MCI5678579.1 helix-hairpin-helix domain-containing protein [Bacteroidales bacterium]MDY3926757.1 helix-hairpin-helix domain-containing protein [Anaerotignum sp.]